MNKIEKEYGFCDFCECEEDVVLLPESRILICEACSVKAIKAYKAFNDLLKVMPKREE